MNRLLSIDVLRGMTISLMILVNTPGSWDYVYSALLHEKWDGLKIPDLVFPFFMFVVGISFYYSTQNTTSKGMPWVQKSIWRGVKLILVGLALNWYPFYTTHLNHLRYFGILQRIGLAYILATCLLWLTKRNHVWLLTIFVCVGYWIVLLTFGDGDLSLSGNLVRKIDIALFGTDHLYHGYGLPFDPEGLLSTLPSVGNILMGYIMAQYLSLWKVNPLSLYKLMSIGLCSIILGWLWSRFGGFPINKPIWSSSYVLVTVGLATLVWVVLVYLIDIKGITRGIYFFKVFGQNPIASFVLSGLVYTTLELIPINDQGLMSYLYVEKLAPIFGMMNASLAFAIAYVLLIWIMAYVLDKRGLYFKV